MTLTKTAEALREDLLAVARFEDAGGRERAVRILDGLVPARLAALLAQMAEEVSAALPAGRVEMRLSGSDVEAVFVEDALMVGPAEDEEAAARLTVRLGGSLKEAVEGAAAEEGISVNSFVVGALIAATRHRGHRHGRRVRGYGRA